NDSLVFSISATASEVGEDGAVSLRISSPAYRPGGPPVNIPIFVAHEGDVLQDPSSLLGPDRHLTFYQNGSTYSEHVVPLKADPYMEPDGFFVVYMVARGGTDYTFGESSSVSVTVLDDDGPLQLSLAPASQFAREDDFARFVINASYPPRNPRTVNIDVVGTDFVLVRRSPTTITLSAGQSSVTLELETQNARNVSTRVMVELQEGTNYERSGATFATLFVVKNTRGEISPRTVRDTPNYDQELGFSLGALVAEPSPDIRYEYLVMSQDPFGYYGADGGAEQPLAVTAGSVAPDFLHGNVGFNLDDWTHTIKFTLFTFYYNETTAMATVLFDPVRTNALRTNRGTLRYDMVRRTYVGGGLTASAAGSFDVIGVDEVPLLRIRPKGTGTVNEGDPVRFIVNTPRGDRTGLRHVADTEMRVVYDIRYMGDYFRPNQATRLTITAERNQSEWEIPIGTLDDDIDEPTGSVVMTLQLSSGYTTVAATASATVRIDGSDPPVLTVAAADTYEEGDEVLFIISADRPPSANQVFLAHVTAHRDFLPIEGRNARVTLLAGKTSLTVTAATLDNDIDEVSNDGGTYRVVWIQLPIHGGDDFRTGDPSAAFVTLRDNDGPELTLAANHSRVTEGGGVNFTVTASMAPEDDVTIVVQERQTDSTDQITLAAGQTTASYADSCAPGLRCLHLTLPAGESAVSYSLNIADNEIDMVDRSMTATLVANSAYTPTSRGYTLGNPSEVLVSITDEDPEPDISVIVDPATAEERDMMLPFPVRLSLQSGKTVTVDYDTSNGSAMAGSVAAMEGQDYTRRSGTLTFMPGRTSMTITVPIIPDSLDEADEETFSFILSNPVNVMLATATVVGT
ncbi:MAG: Calx-beta domain-containing protein, partial [Pseudohongiellaceae bacterium]